MDECWQEHLHNIKDWKKDDLETRMHQLEVELQEQLQLEAKDHRKIRTIAQVIFFHRIELLRRKDAAIARFMENLVPFLTTTEMGKNDLMLLLYPPNNTLIYPNPNSSN